MKKLAMCLAPIWIFVACGVDSATDAPAASAEDTAAMSLPAADEAAATAAPDLGVSPFQPCSPGSQDNCSGQMLGTACVSHPGEFCLTFGHGQLCHCAAR